MLFAQKAAFTFPITLAEAEMEELHTIMWQELEIGKYLLWREADLTLRHAMTYEDALKEYGLDIRKNYSLDHFEVAVHYDAPRDSFAAMGFAPVYENREGIAFVGIRDIQPWLPQVLLENLKQTISAAMPAGIAVDSGGVERKWKDGLIFQRIESENGLYLSPTKEIAHLIIKAFDDRQIKSARVSYGGDFNRSQLQKAWQLELENFEAKNVAAIWVVWELRKAEKWVTRGLEPDNPMADLQFNMQWKYFGIEGPGGTVVYFTLEEVRPYFEAAGIWVDDHPVGGTAEEAARAKFNYFQMLFRSEYARMRGMKVFWD